MSGLPLDLLMFLALCILVLSGFPVVFVLTGTAMLFAGLGWLLGDFPVQLLGALPQRIWGTMTSELLIAIPLFIFMGMMLERSRIAEELLENMGRLFGRVRGGLAVSVTLVGALLAASTGIIGATVVTMGLIALPAMLRRGYAPAFASGSICAAGTLGQIIPPSTVMIIVGEYLSAAYQQAQFAQGKFSVETISVGQLFAGSMLPGLMLVLLYVGFQLAFAFLRPRAAPALAPADEEGERPSLGALLRALAVPLLLIVAVLGSILGGIATPTEAAAIGATGATLMAAWRAGARRSVLLAVASLLLLMALAHWADLRLGRGEAGQADRPAILAAFGVAALLGAALAACLRRLWRAQVLSPVMGTTMTITGTIFAVLIGATLFSLVFRGLGGDHTIERLLTGMPGGVTGALIFVMLLVYLLGLFLDYVEISIIIIPLMGPFLLAQGVDPVWLGVLLAVNMQTSFLTPPFGYALFYLRRVAPPSVTTGAIYRGVLPFIALQLLGLLLVGLFPGLATWLPGLLFG